jgi:hypothetical protein
MRRGGVLIVQEEVWTDRDHVLSRPILANTALAGVVGDRLFFGPSRDIGPRAVTETPNLDVTPSYPCPQEP